MAGDRGGLHSGACSGTPVFGSRGNHRAGTTLLPRDCSECGRTHQLCGNDRTGPIPILVAPPCIGVNGCQSGALSPDTRDGSIRLGWPAVLPRRVCVGRYTDTRVLLAVDRALFEGALDTRPS